MAPPKVGDAGLFKGGNFDRINYVCRWKRSDRFPTRSSITLSYSENLGKFISSRSKVRIVGFWGVYSSKIRLNETWDEIRQEHLSI